MNHENIAALWTNVHWLIVLAQQGSFTAAASHLNVSKAAMSQRIAELERAAGVSLVRRTTRSMRLTEAGQQLVDATHGAFDQIANSFEGVRDLAEAPQGTLRLTAPVAFARQQLVSRLSGFLHAHPLIRVELELSDHLSSLTAEGFDLAIRHTSAPPETHVAWTLCATSTVVVASRAYIRRCGLPLSPQALSQHACLHYPRRQSPITWTFERKTRKKSQDQRIIVPVKGPLAVNNSEGLRDAALDGLGIALVPDFTAQRALNSGELLRLLPEWNPVGVFGDTLYAIRPYSSHVPQAVRILVDYLRDNLKAGFDV